MFISQRELEVGIRGGALGVEPPEPPVAEDGPIEIAPPLRVARIVEIALHLLAGKQTGRFLFGNCVERMRELLRLQHGAAEREAMLRHVRLRGGDALGFIGEKPVVRALLCRLLQLGDEVPAELGEQRVEEMRPRVGLVAFGQADVIFLPQRLSEFVERIGGFLRRRVGQSTKMPPQIRQRENAARGGGRVRFVAEEKWELVGHRSQKGGVIPGRAPR